MAKVHIKFQTAKETAEKWLIIAYYFYFDGNIWEKIHFYVVCTSVTRGEERGGECSPPLILYIGKEKAKEDALKGKDSLFMMVSIFACISFPS